MKRTILTIAILMMGCEHATAPVGMVLEECATELTFCEEAETAAFSDADFAYSEVESIRVRLVAAELERDHWKNEAARVKKLAELLSYQYDGLFEVADDFKSAVMILDPEIIDLNCDAGNWADHICKWHWATQ